MTLHDYNLLEPQRFTILIVDDDSQSIQILAAILSGDKYRISTALSGKQALDIVDRISPDLIIMDIIMPDIDGFEVCKILKGSPKTRDIPVIFVTAKDEPEDILKGFSIGAVDYVKKPFNAAEMLARVHTHADLKRKGDNEKKLNSLLTTMLKERELAEEGLRESERKFRAIFDQTYQFIGLMTVDGVLIEANSAALKLGGIKESDVIGKPFWETPWWSHSPKLQEKLRTAVQKAAEGEFVRFEATHPAADGSLRCVDFSLKPVMDEAGNVVLLIPEGRDISDRKQAEKELQQAHDTLERLVEERTAELLLKNRQLLDEIEERKRIQKILRTKNLELNAAYEQLAASGKEIVQKYEELTKSRQDLLESEQRLFSIIQGSPIPTFVIGKDHNVFYWNKALENLSNINAKAVIGTKQHWRAFYGMERPCMADILVDEAAEKIPQWYDGKYSKSKLTKEAFEATDFFPSLGKGGSWLRFTAAAIRDSTGNLIGAIETLEDITERKKMEVMLQESEAKYRTIFETTASAIVIIEEDTTMSLINNEFEKLSGYSRKETTGKKSWTEFILKDDLAKIKNYHDLRRLDPDAAPRNYEFRFIHSDGSIRDASATAAMIPGTQKSLVSILDITDRKRAEETLRESEEKYRSLASTEDSMYLVDRECRYLFMNEGHVSRFGVTLDKIIGRSYSEFHSEESSKAFEEIVNKVLATGNSIQHEHKSERDGRYFLRTFSPVKDKAGRETIAVTVVSKDITELMEAEESLRKAEAEYRSIFENSQDGIFQTTPEGQFITANQAMANILGYESPRELFSAITDIPGQLYVNPEDREALAQMMREYGPVKGFETQQYRKDGSKIWVSLNIHHVYDAEGNVSYYEGMIEDITIRKQSEGERKHNIERLRTVLGATIQAMSYAVETRDPYTAGHQKRVSDLARTIATEMGLSSDQVDGIRMASAIHDIGKISVPAEILSKPTKLTDIEFGLIKIHPQSGYNILKEIEFPWPIDKIILQHHERLDGSGYPRGLSGKEILLEAKILAVADVVEAMASHRPYRPAIGIEKALDEISQNKGILYDHEVVDACCRLFTEKRFSFAHDA